MNHIEDLLKQIPGRYIEIRRGVPGTINEFYALMVDPPVGDTGASLVASGSGPSLDSCLRDLNTQARKELKR